MSKGKVLILGINGHVGQFAAQEFQHAGYAVTGFGRSNRHGITGIEFITGDAADLSVLQAAIAEADVVFNGLNLPYDKWDNGRAEAQLATVIEAMGSSGKTMLFPGNVYNYAASDRRMAPSTPQRPQTPRGEIRVRQEQMLKAASDAGKFQTIILRAGDFFGPGTSNDWFDLVMLADAGKGVIKHMGDLDKFHAWAYLPDLARAFVALADQRKSLGAFETFHFAGHYVSHGQMMAAIQNVAPAPMRVRPAPWWMLQGLGLVMPMLREVVKMRYLWTHAMELVDPRLGAILGPDFGTPLDEAVAVAAAPFFEKAKKAA